MELVCHDGSISVYRGMGARYSRIHSIIGKNTRSVHNELFGAWNDHNILLVEYINLWKSYKWVPTGTAGGDRIIHTIYNNTPNSMKAHGESPNPISMEEFKDVLLKAQSRCTGSVDLIDMSNLYNKPTYPQHKNYFTILITAVHTYTTNTNNNQESSTVLDNISIRF